MENSQLLHLGLQRYCLPLSQTTQCCTAEFSYLLLLEHLLLQLLNHLALVVDLVILG